MDYIFRKSIFKLKNFWKQSLKLKCIAFFFFYSSILHAGKDSSCITTVLLLAKTMMLRSCCFSWVSWYHSLITSESCVGINVTCQTKSTLQKKLQKEEWWGISLQYWHSTDVHNLGMESCLLRDDSAISGSESLPYSIISVRNRAFWNSLKYWILRLRVCKALLLHYQPTSMS